MSKEFPKSRVAFISDAGLPDIPQYLIVKDTEAEIVAAALAVYDAQYPDGGDIKEEEKWAFWVEYAETPGHFALYGYARTREGIEHFFDGPAKEDDD